jgi:hypothetical protein
VSHPSSPVLPPRSPPDATTPARSPSRIPGAWLLYPLGLAVGDAAVAASAHRLGATLLAAVFVVLGVATAGSAVLDGVDRTRHALATRDPDVA